MVAKESRPINVTGLTIRSFPVVIRSVAWTLLIILELLFEEKIVKLLQWTTIDVALL